MHTIIGLLKKDCGISFLYKIAVENELKSGILKEIPLDDFKMQHDFDIIWEKHSIYTDKYLSVCEEFIWKSDNYAAASRQILFHPICDLLLYILRSTGQFHPDNPL